MEKHSTLEEHGFASRFTELSLFLDNGEHKHSKKYIHMRVNSKETLPEEFQFTPIKELPPCYQNPIYVSPSSIQLNIYKSDIALKDPNNLSNLITNCDNTERIYINMYPGGSGCEVLQYKQYYDVNLKNKWIRATWFPQYFPGNQHGIH